jgi:hypothetical protein
MGLSVVLIGSGGASGLPFLGAKVDAGALGKGALAAGCAVPPLFWGGPGQAAAWAYPA